MTESLGSWIPQTLWAVCTPRIPAPSSWLEAGAEVIKPLATLAFTILQNERTNIMKAAGSNSYDKSAWQTMKIPYLNRTTWRLPPSLNYAAALAIFSMALPKDLFYTYVSSKIALMLASRYLQIDVNPLHSFRKATEWQWFQPKTQITPKQALNESAINRGKDTLKDNETIFWEGIGKPIADHLTPVTKAAITPTMLATWCDDPDTEKSCRAVIEATQVSPEAASAIVQCLTSLKENREFRIYLWTRANFEGLVKDVQLNKSKLPNKFSHKVHQHIVQTQQKKVKNEMRLGVPVAALTVPYALGAIKNIATPYNKDVLTNSSIIKYSSYRYQDVIAENILGSATGLSNTTTTWKDLNTALQPARDIACQNDMLGSSLETVSNIGNHALTVLSYAPHLHLARTIYNEAKAKGWNGVKDSLPIHLATAAIYGLPEVMTTALGTALGSIAQVLTLGLVESSNPSDLGWWCSKGILLGPMIYEFGKIVVNKPETFGEQWIGLSNTVESRIGIGTISYMANNVLSNLGTGISSFFRGMDCISLGG